MECVGRIKSHVVADLWNKALREFQSAVIGRFAKDVFDGIEDINAYLDDQQKELLTTANSPYIYLLQRRLEEAVDAHPNGVVEILKQEPALQAKVDEAALRFAMAFRNSLLVELIQRKVISDGQRDSLKLEFRDFGSISGSPDCERLRAIIQKWSSDSNLDAAWCRDHAVAVLRKWLSHPQLRFVGLYESEKAMQQTGWASATQEISFASVYSRVSVDIAVYGENGPTPLDFKWKSYDFRLPGYNHLKTSQASYRQKSLAAFELYAQDQRRTPLWQIVNSESETLDLNVEPYSELLARFNKAIEKNISSNIKTAEKARKNLPKKKTKRALPLHLLWAVHYHVPPTKTLDEIVNIEQSVHHLEELFRSKKSATLTEKDIERTVKDEDILAFQLCLMRGLIREERDGALSRVIDRLVESKANDLLGPYENADQELKARAEIERLTTKEIEKNGDLNVRYIWTRKRKTDRIPDPSTVMRGVHDVLELIDLAKRPDAKRGRIRGHKNKYDAALRALGR